MMCSAFRPGCIPPPPRKVRQAPQAMGSAHGGRSVEWWREESSRGFTCKCEEVANAKKWRKAIWIRGGAALLGGGATLMGAGAALDLEHRARRPQDVIKDVGHTRRVQGQGGAKARSGCLCHRQGHAVHVCGRGGRLLGHVRGAMGCTRGWGWGTGVRRGRTGTSAPRLEGRAARCGGDGRTCMQAISALPSAPAAKLK